MPAYLRYIAIHTYIYQYTYIYLRTYILRYIHIYILHTYIQVIFKISVLLLYSPTCNLTRRSSMFTLQLKNDAPIVGEMWLLYVLCMYLVITLVFPTPAHITTYHYFIPTYIHTLVVIIILYYAEFFWPVYIDHRRTPWLFWDLY